MSICKIFIGGCILLYKYLLIAISLIILSYKRGCIETITINIGWSIVLRGYFYQVLVFIKRIGYKRYPTTFFAISTIVKILSPITTSEHKESITSLYFFYFLERYQMTLIIDITIKIFFPCIIYLRGIYFFKQNTGMNLYY